MASSEENIAAGMPSSSTELESDIRPINSRLSSQHLIFANLVRNRGGIIQHQEKTTQSSSCDRCVEHRKKFSANSHDPPCRHLKDQLRSKSSQSINEQEQYTNNQLSVHVVSEGTIRNDRTKSRIPIRLSTITSSNTRQTPLNKKSKIPIPIRQLNIKERCNKRIESNETYVGREIHPSTIESSEPIDSISVRFRPTNTIYEVRVYRNMTVEKVIDNVCRQANMSTIENDCYLWFDFRELIANETIFENGLHQTWNKKDSLPEVRLRFTQILETSIHISQDVFLASSENIDLKKILNISLSPKKEDILPNILKELTKQIVRNTPTINRNQTILIPLPNFSRQCIDSLPTVNLTIPLSPNEFDWNEFLQCLADDLEIQQTDLIIVNVEEGSIIFKLKLIPKLKKLWNKTKKIVEKVRVMFLPKCEQFIKEHNSSNITKVDKIKIELENFETKNINKNDYCLSFDEISIALRLCQRPTVISKKCWTFLIEKSRQISTIIMQSIQSCSQEFIIDHVSIIYNENICEKYLSLTNIGQEERVLFHGTNIDNFDGIFEANFQNYFKNKRTDSGWYGQGIYFSNSPWKASFYAKPKSKIVYLICSLVRLGKTLEIKDKSFEGKPMAPDYDSHYVQTRRDGYPIELGEIPVFEEYVIKKNEQIMPLYIIGLLSISSFVIWRDAKITNEANGNLFKKMKQKYAFNIYGCQTSVEALKILQLKLTNDQLMNCVVITNGADDGESFVRECRKIQSSLPVTVYCLNKAYHQQWAATLLEPKINVTSSPEEVFTFITNTLQN
ncbi:hypothetical protein I4U23_000222 [Adineta vaga]|nr:hypothetical protein I4U23_000222 [Adineta vaga]